MGEEGAKDSVKGLEEARRGGKKEEARHEAYSHRGHSEHRFRGMSTPPRFIGRQLGKEKRESKHKFDFLPKNPLSI